jgi:hypothetical protein
MVKGSTHNKLDVYSGFGRLSRWIFSKWENIVITIRKQDDFYPYVNKFNKQLKNGNVIIFFDHHYAFDALPLGLVLGKNVKYLSKALIPYAVHLDMGVGREGQKSFWYWLRTRSFQWFVRNIRNGHPEVHFMPVAREFEMESTRLRNIVQEKYQGINTHYIRTLIRFFSRKSYGNVCFLTPFSGIAFPGKQVLHPHLYRSIGLALSKKISSVEFYLAGAYPKWGAYQNYLAPLLSSHNIVMRGPFSFSLDDYDAASQLLEAKLIELRKTAKFDPPNYSRLQTK